MYDNKNMKYFLKSIWEDINFVKSYSLKVETNAYNSLCERPAIKKLCSNILHKSVLDAGCAGGGLSKWLISQGADVTSVDKSPIMVTITKGLLGNNENIFQLDLETSKGFFKSESFDLIICSLTLHYMKNWDICLSEFYRALKPKGLLIITTHHPIADFSKSFSKNYHDIEYIEEEWPNFLNTPVRVGFYRRPLSNIFDMVQDANFDISLFSEPRPLPKMKKLFPSSFFALNNNPPFILLSCKKKTL